MFLYDLYVMIRGEISDFYKYIKGYKNRHLLDIYSEQDKIYFMMTPTYGNLGDQAIEIATTKWLIKNLPGYKIIKIHLQDTGKYLWAVKRTLKEKDLIVLQGGGNFGDMYATCERARRRIIKNIKNNFIISMPSSIFYLNTLKGKIELTRSKLIYNKSKKLICLTRDIFSYEFAKEHFYGCRIILSPDIVLYMQEKNMTNKREYVLLCIRTDKESAIKEHRNHLINLLFEKYEDVIIIDTQLYRDIDDVCKDKEVESILRIFRKAKIVVTDRLHGLIFSVITNTPCVAIASMDRKIEGICEWLKENDMMTFCYANQITDIEWIVDRTLKHKSENGFDISMKLDDVMHEIINIIKNMEGKNGE